MEQSDETREPARSETETDQDLSQLHKGGGNSVATHGVGERQVALFRSPQHTNGRSTGVPLKPEMSAALVRTKKGDAVGMSPILGHSRQVSVVGISEAVGIQSPQSKLWQQSRDLFIFLKPLEQQIRKARVSVSRRNGNSVERMRRIAQLVLSIIRNIAERETGVLAIEVDVPLLGERLAAGPTETAIVEGLIRRAERALGVGFSSRTFLGDEPNYSSKGVSLSYDVIRELEELSHFLTWYARRRISIYRLVAEDPRLKDDVIDSDYGDQIFGLQVIHDQRVFGAKGFVVRCSAHLIGHDGDTLWFRVGVLDRGNEVAVRPGWESWSDSNGEEGSHLHFASLVPLRPDSQQAVVDQLVAFVPYGALLLDAGRSSVSISVSIADAQGYEYLRVNQRQNISIPVSEFSAQPVPAPQSVGIWPVDVVRGDRVSRLRVKAGYKQMGGWEMQCISATCDLMLCMHGGSEVLLECRLLNAAGKPIEMVGVSPGGEQNDGTSDSSSFRYRRALYPKTAWARFENLLIDIPVSQLLLAAGQHELTCELVILSEDGRVMCGDMMRFGLKVPAAPGEAEDEQSEPAVENQSRDGSRRKSQKKSPEVELESIEIDPEWNFSGRDSVRVQATLCPRYTTNGIVQATAGRNQGLFVPYRVVISLEREQGEMLFESTEDGLGIGFVPFIRGVCVEGHVGFREHCIVCNFSRDDILTWLALFESAQGAMRAKLIARIRAVTLDGVVFINESREFFLKPRQTNMPQLKDPIPVHGPVIVDVVARRLVKSPVVSVRVLLNVPTSGQSCSDYVVRCTPLTKEEPGNAKALSGQHQHHRLRPNPWWLRRGLELMQISREFEIDLKAQDIQSVKVELLDPEGRVVQGLEQFVLRSGLLDESSKQRDQSTSETAEKNVRPKGIFSWLQRSDA